MADWVIGADMELVIILSSSDYTFRYVKRLHII